MRNGSWTLNTHYRDLVLPSVPGRGRERMMPETTGRFADFLFSEALIFRHVP